MPFAELTSPVRTSARLGTRKQVHRYLKRQYNALRTVLHILLLPGFVRSTLRGDGPVVVSLANRRYAGMLEALASDEGACLRRPLVMPRLPREDGPLRRWAIARMRRIWQTADRDRVIFAHWGAFFVDWLGYDPSEDGFAARHLEEDLIGFGYSQNRSLVGYICDRQAPYFVGGRSTDLEAMLSAYRSGDWRNNVCEQRAVEILRASEQHKYRQFGAQCPQALDPCDVLVMGQVASDFSWRMTDTLVADNAELVGRAVAAFPDARRILFKAHPRWCAIAEDRARIAALYPQVEQLDPKLNFKTLIRMRPRVVVNTSGTGLDAGLAGCEVHCFGVSFYAGWGATVDHLPTPARRTNRLGFEDIFVVTNLHYARHFHRDTRAEADTADIVAALEARN